MLGELRSRLSPRDERSGLLPDPPIGEPALRRRARVLGPAGAAFLLLLMVWVVREASTGIGGQSMPSILVQCVFKSYASVEPYSKSGETFRTMTEVLTGHGRRPRGASYLSSDFATDKMSRHNYSGYCESLSALCPAAPRPNPPHTPIPTPPARRRPAGALRGCPGHQPAGGGRKKGGVSQDVARAPARREQGVWRGH